MNTTRMSKSCVAVAVRIKPLETGSKSCGLEEQDATSLIIPRLPQNKPTSALENRTFKVDSVLGESATQEECFEKTTAPLISSLIDGFNGTVLAYGQTGFYRVLLRFCRTYPRLTYAFDLSIRGRKITHNVRT